MSFASVYSVSVQSSIHYYGSDNVSPYLGGSNSPQLLTQVYNVYYISATNLPSVHYYTHTPSSTYVKSPSQVFIHSLLLITGYSKLHSLTQILFSVY